MTYLQRAYQLCDFGSAHSKQSDVRDWLRCLGAAAYNLGVPLWKNGCSAAAVPLVRASCDWGNRALVFMGDDVEKEVYAKDKAALANRYELSAVCYQDTGDKQVNLSPL